MERRVRGRGRATFAPRFGEFVRGEPQTAGYTPNQGMNMRFEGICSTTHMFYPVVGRNPKFPEICRNFPILATLTRNVTVAFFRNPLLTPWGPASDSIDLLGGAATTV